MKQYDNLSKGMLGRLVSNVKSKLAPVAFSGNYSDLSDAPNPDNFVSKSGGTISGSLNVNGISNTYGGFNAYSGTGTSYYGTDGKRRMWVGVDADNVRAGLHDTDKGDYFVWRDDDGTHVDINVDAVGGENKYIRSVRQENGKLVAEEAKGPFIELTLDEWNALPDTKYTDGVAYLINDGDTEQEPDYPLSAQSVFYANQNSGLPAFDVQNAIDQLSCYEDVSNKFTVPEDTNLTSYSVHAYRIGNFVTFYAVAVGTINANTKIFSLPSEWRIKNHIILAAQNIGANYLNANAGAIINKDNNTIYAYPFGGDHSLGFQLSGIIPIEQTITVPDPVEQSYLDITDQIQIPDGSPVRDKTGYIQNGIVMIRLSINSGTAANGYSGITIPEEYAPIVTMPGIETIVSSRNDIGVINGYITTAGSIVINTKATLAGNENVTFIYPLKKPMASNPGIAVAKQELDYENKYQMNLRNSLKNQAYTVPNDGIVCLYYRLLANKRGGILINSSKMATYIFMDTITAGVYDEYRSGQFQVSKGDVLTFADIFNMDDTYTNYFTFIPYKLVGG